MRALRREFKPPAPRNSFVYRDIQRNLHNTPMRTILQALTILAMVVAGQLVAHGQSSPIELADVAEKGTFAPKGVMAMRPIPGDRAHYSALKAKVGILQYSYETGEQTGTLLSFADLPEGYRQPSEYSTSPNGRYVLLEYEYEPLYRRSYSADFQVYDTQSKALVPLSSHGKVRLPTFSPNSTQVAYVWKNNIYIVELGSMLEEQVTSDGAVNQVINGAPDWVYEEEFALTTGIFWSPDSRYLAYLRWDESDVREYTMPIYGKSLYPTEYRYKYPKAGEKNALISLHVYDGKSLKNLKINTGLEADQYLPRVQWSPRGELTYMRLNREQNHLELLQADLNTGKSAVFFEEKDACYIEEPTDWYLTFVPDSQLFIVPSERDGTRQLYLCSMKGGEPQQITRGRDEVKRVYEFNPSEGKVYYQAYDGSPLNLGVFRAPIFQKKRKGKKSERERISESQGICTATFMGDYYVLGQQSVNEVPKYTLHSLDGKQIRLLEDNHELKDRLSAYALPEKRFFTFRGPSGDTLNGYLVLPVGYDSTKRYPVMMTQYSGPNSQEVLNRWEVGFDQYLASRGVVVACVDGRGTGGRGREFRKCTYGQLGKLEVEDQIAAAKYLQAKPWVDAERVGIWGWSYGGYMSTLCLLRGADVFCMAVAVAPVTNWRFYDSIYTERYMGLPRHNANGYDENAPLFYADALKGKLLVMHGTADDNVHFQNTMRLTEALIRAGKQCDLFTFPDRNHFIYGNGARGYLYTHMDQYITENLLR